MFTKQIKSPLLPEIKSIITSMDTVYSYERYSTSIKEWLSPIINLEKFYVYPTNGITDGLNYFLSVEKRNIIRNNGDYEWVDNKFNNSDSSILYMSNPSSIDGNFTSIPEHIPVALDIAYIGTTEIKSIEIKDNVEYVFYSLSKPFGVNQYRTGWIFTRFFDPKLYNLCYRANYYNYFSHHLSERIIKEFSIDYIYCRFKDFQADVCNQYDLIPSDSVWLATSKDLQYKNFFRTDTARLCITELFNDQKTYK